MIRVITVRLVAFYLQDEKYMAGAYCQQLEGERGGAMTQVLEEDSTPKSVSHKYIHFLQPHNVVYCTCVLIRFYQGPNAQLYSGQKHECHSKSLV